MTRLFLAPLAIAAAALAPAVPAAAQTRAATPGQPPAGAKSSPPAWARGKPLYVTVTDAGFAPRRIVMKSGAGYILHIANRSDKGHNFSARSFFRLARVDPRDQAWVADDQVKLAAGERATVHLIAPATPGARYEYRSTVLADAGEKMRGAIYVR